MNKLETNEKFQQIIGDIKKKPMEISKLKSTIMEIASTWRGQQRKDRRKTQST